VVSDWDRVVGTAIEVLGNTQVSMSRGSAGRPAGAVTPVLPDVAREIFTLPAPRAGPDSCRWRSRCWPTSSPGTRPGRWPTRPPKSGKAGLTLTAEHGSVAARPFGRPGQPNVVWIANP